jgi:transcriptional regulator with XRE-family HTH domain
MAFAMNPRRHSAFAGFLPSRLRSACVPPADGHAVIHSGPFENQPLPMTVSLDSTANTLRKRFGAFIQARRMEIGMTQLELCVALDYAQPTMVSQVERGASALPEVDLAQWAGLLQMEPEALGRQFLYFCRPFIYEALYGVDPFAAERVPRPAKTIKPRPGKPGA